MADNQVPTTNQTAAIDGGGDDNPTSSISSTAFTQSSGSQYEELTIIGSGAYGTVYRARDRNHDRKFVALKKIRVMTTDIGVPPNILREIAVLRQLNSFDHPNVVKLVDICQSRSSTPDHFNIFLVFEHVHQDLSTYMEKCPSPGLSLDNIKDLMFQILTGVDFLHSNRIIHRDLKPANILISNNGQVKIADFGLARIYQQAQPLTAVVVTLWYRAPEVLLQTDYGCTIDIWSCGCIFAELYTNKPLFGGQSENDQLFKIFGMIGAPHPSEWPTDLFLPWEQVSHYKRQDLKEVIKDVCSNGKDLFEKMLIFHPQKRISARQALSHDYFNELRPNNNDDNN